MNKKQQIELLREIAIYFGEKHAIAFGERFNFWSDYGWWMQEIANFTSDVIRQEKEKLSKICNVAYDRKFIEGVHTPNEISGWKKCATFIQNEIYKEKHEK